ncbi:queuosine precursor transporter [Desulfotruncus alcoholivorax]|uniref:queuosine precursor transporter n=1 Tax=Desulfotruncus alcoholivorax TaxID=265477 RepID=UPI000419E365|nr:queuosine precursor transporter [Desulfotruncus alcoholivorax]
MFKEIESKFYVILCVYITALMVANVASSKVITLFGLFVPAGFVAYSLTFLMTDAVSEIWGKDRAKKVVILGLYMNILMVALLQISIHLPAAPFWANQESYKLILNGSIRIVGASLSAYLVSQFTDVWAFLAIKKLTGGRYLWLRNNGSTYLSQAVDTMIFITLAFYGLVPNIALINMIIAQYVVKVGITIINTPFFYALVYWIRGGCKEEGGSNLIHN